MPFGELLHTAAQRAGAAVIDQLSLSVIGDQYILRLQISEHKTALMQVPEFLQQLEPHQPKPRSAVFGQKMMQRPAFYITHHIKRHAVVFLKIIRFE
ncbi:hypothetical protein D3C75_1079370 [compost metagenome]